MSDGTIKNVEIFSVGTWRGSKTVEATPALLDQIVSNFNTVNKTPGYGVSIKLGHNSRIGEPAYGWMTDLQRVDNTLVADFADVPPEIVDAVSKRRYNSVSVELWPLVNFDGKQVENVLGGVALLGAEWPAVKGLKPLSASLFAADWSDEKVVLSEKEQETELSNFTEEQHATLLTAAVTKAKDETKVEFTAKLAAAETAKTAAEKRATDAEAALAELADKADKDAIAAIITAAEAKGQIVPANKGKVLAFAESVRTATTGEARKSLLATFKEFVEAMPAKVKFGENGVAKPVTEAAEGQKVSDQLDAAVKAHMAANTGSTYEKSLAAVFAADPELKTAYAQEM